MVPNNDKSVENLRNTMIRSIVKKFTSLVEDVKVGSMPDTMKELEDIKTTRLDFIEKTSSYVKEKQNYLLKTKCQSVKQFKEEITTMKGKTEKCSVIVNNLKSLTKMIEEMYNRSVRSKLIDLHKTLLIRLDTWENVHNLWVYSYENWGRIVRNVTNYLRAPSELKVLKIGISSELKTMPRKLENVKELWKCV